MDQKEEERSARHQVRNVLIVFLSSIVTGCLVVVGMILYWGPTGRYMLQDILIKPQILEGLSYNDSGIRLAFDGVDFRYFDPTESQWRENAVSNEAYAQFYQLILNDESLDESANVTEQRFDSTRPSRLTMWVRPVGGQFARRIFQEMDFSPNGHLYRVHLPGQATGQWVYYDHPGIHQAAFHLFVPSS